MKINFFQEKNVRLFQKKMEIYKNVLHVIGISKVASYSNIFHIKGVNLWTSILSGCKSWKIYIPNILLLLKYINILKARMKTAEKSLERKS